MPSSPANGSSLLSFSWIRDVTSLLDQYRMVALLVICLAIAVTVWRGKNKDFGFWLCWTIVGLCSLTIIGSEIKNQIGTGEAAGGIIAVVPNNMLVYSDAPGFFVARRRNGSFSDRSDYDWIRLGASNNSDFRHLSIIVDQNKKKVRRDINTLVVIGEEVDPAPIRFDLVIPFEEVDLLRSRRLGLELHTPSGSLPYLMDGSRRMAGSVWDPNDAEDTTSNTGHALQKSDLLLIPRAYAQSPNVDVEEALKSTRLDIRSQGLQALQSQFDNRLGWMNTVLESGSSSRDLQLNVISAIRAHFKDDSGIIYPNPLQFRFITSASYVRIILDGLDTTTPLGINSRLLLNNVRDTRVDQAFLKVSNAVFSSSDSAHKSCIALFHLGIHYNWAFLAMDQQIKSGQPFSLTTIRNLSDIIDQAQPDLPLLVGDDVVQAARLDYVRGVVFGTIATSDASMLGPDIDRSTMLDKSKGAFQKFLNKLTNPQRDAYRYPAHFDVAKSFLATPTAAALQPINFTANPEHGCSDPGESS